MATFASRIGDVVSRIAAELKTVRQQITSYSLSGGFVAPPAKGIADLGLAAVGAGRIAYVTDTFGGPCVAFSDGQVWRRVQDWGIVTKFFDFASGRLPAGSQFRRAGTAYRMGPNGLLSLEAIDGPRFDYRPVTAQLRGLLLEGAATNYVGWSEDVSNSAGWGQVLTASSDAVLAPNGTMTADLCVPGTATNNYGNTSNSAASFVNGMPFTFSIYAKAAGYRYVRLSCTPSVFNQGRHGVFDLVAKVCTGDTANVSCALEELPNGWFRCSMTITAQATVSATAMTFGVLNNYVAGPVSFAGDGVSGIVFWGAQVEAGAQASSYVPTPSSATAVTRSADALVTLWQTRGVADGIITIRVTFDDGTTQDVATTVTLGQATVPTPLNRARILLAERV